MTETLQTSHISVKDKLALGFLKILDSNTNNFCFRTFDDVRIDGGKSRGDLTLLRKIDGTLKEALPELRSLNHKGAGVFVVVNEGGQQKSEIVKVRAVFADTDGAPLDPLLVLKPHLVVESSKGNWHVYWKVSDCPISQFSEIQSLIAEKFGTDPSVKDLPRIMRLPGFNHNKYEPYLSKITIYNPELDAYTIDSLKDGLGISRSDKKIEADIFKNFDLFAHKKEFKVEKLGSTDSKAPYPFTPENACEVFNAAKVVHPNIQTEEEFSEWGLMCANLIKLDGWPEREVEPIFDAICDLAPNADKTHNRSKFKSYKQQAENYAGNARRVASLFYEAREKGWIPETSLQNDVTDRLNLEYAWLEAEASIYRLRYRDFISIEKFNAAHANQLTFDSSNKQITVSKKWMTDPRRRQHKGIVTRPDQPEVTSDGYLNNWQGFAVEPSLGDVTPFTNLYSYMFGDEKYPLTWLGHLVQNPGIKMYPSLVIWSPEEGVGKNLFFEAVQNLFPPEHATVISQSEVEDDFSGWIPGTVFAIADEIKAARSDKVRDKLKIWSTATTLRTHDKGQPKRVVPNLLNLVFLSNHADGMHLTDTDRRFFIWEVTAKPLPQNMIDEFVKWRGENGLSYLLHYLQNIDISGFNPKGRSPITQAKVDMVEASRSDLERWCKDVVTGSISFGKEITTAEYLVNAFCHDFPNMKSPPSISYMGKTIARMGARTRKNQVRLSNGRKIRAIAILRPDYWEKKNDLAWRDEFERKTYIASEVAESASPGK
ncbi:MAG: hypothetical protein CTY33_05905 [Methylotenera sp.]|nr:MAG: hypothetical protein CTY33_05905 [Methylotenera sp.]